MIDIERLRQHIERVLNKGHELIQEFLVRSETNVNRRTFFIVSIGLVVLILMYVFFIRPPSDFPAGQLVEIPEGASLNEIATFLKEQHVVRSKLWLQASVFLFGYERTVQYGDYLFKEPRNVFSVARAIGIGARGLEPIRIRVPEGSTVSEMAELFDTELLRFDKEKFIQNALPYEGYLFPDTYFFLPNANEDLVIRTLRQSFDAQIAILASSTEKFGRPLKDVVIMASILEKEARTFEDKRMIAGILWKRLDKNMALQVDAVFLYSIGKTTFDLTKEDLANKEDPYNTYANKGLPPTPIGSPSLDSLKAAITPIKSGYWYYLADRNYVTYYSATYEEHLEKRRLYLGS